MLQEQTPSRPGNSRHGKTAHLLPRKPGASAGVKSSRGYCPHGDAASSCWQHKFAHVGPGRGPLPDYECGVESLLAAFEDASQRSLVAHTALLQTISIVVPNGDCDPVRKSREDFVGVLVLTEESHQPTMQRLDIFARFPLVS